MNGIRYGLSFSLLALACGAYHSRERILGVGAFLAAVSVHLSAAGGVALFFLSRSKWFLLIFSVLAAVVFYTFFYNYLYLKVEAYTLYQRPSFLSGLSPLFLHVALFSWLKANGKHFSSSNVFDPLALVVFQIFGYAVSSFTYAGLRLQWLFLFLFVLHLSFLEPQRSRLSFWVSFPLFLLGLSGFLSFMRTILLEQELWWHSSAFLPYAFYWD